MLSDIRRPVNGSVVRSIWRSVLVGASTEPQFPEKEFYFTDFAGVANNTTLRSLPGWSAYNSTSSTAASRDQWQVQSNAITRTSSNQDFATAPGLFVIGRDTAQTDHVFRCKLVTAPNDGELINIVVAATHQNNCVFFECTKSAGTFGSFIIRKNVGGTLTQLMSQASATSGLGRPLAAGDEIELQVIGQGVHLFINGRRITAAAGADMDTGGAYTKGTVCGFGSRGAVASVFDDVYMAGIGGTVAIATTPIFWPGSVALAGRSVPVSGTYTGIVQAMDYRVVNDSTNAVVKDWARISGATIAGGAWSASVFVPMCSTATNPKVRVQVRAANDTDMRVMTGATTVGLTVGNYGQSNASYRGQYGATSHSVQHAYSWGNPGNGWEGGATTTLTRVQLWATKMAERCGIPVGVFVYGVGSQSIDNLTNSGAGYFDDLETTAAQANATGYIAGWLWTQGEAEAAAAGSFNETAYRATFDTLLGKLRGPLSVNSSVPVGICVIGHTSGGHISGATFGDTNWSAVRAGLSRLVDKPGVFMATHLTDATLADSLHYTANAYVENGRRAGLSMANALGYSGINGRGPIITGATRSGAVITLTVDLNGATSISGTGLTNYQVSSDDFATLKTISSASVSGNTIVITLSSDPAASIKIRSFYGMTWTSPVRAIGSYADGTTIPVEPLYVPITAV